MYLIQPTYPLLNTTHESDTSQVAKEVYINKKITAQFVIRKGLALSVPGAQEAE